MNTRANSSVDREAFKAKVAADVKAAQARVEATRQRVRDGSALFKSRSDAAVAKARADIEAAKERAKAVAARQRRPAD